MSELFRTINESEIAVTLILNQKRNTLIVFNFVFSNLYNTMQYYYSVHVPFIHVLTKSLSNYYSEFYFPL